MKTLFWIRTLFFVAVGCLVFSKEAKQAPEKFSQVPVQISSDPPGSLVLFCEGNTFDDKKAISFGTTPLLRNYLLSDQKPYQIKASKAGFKDWEAAFLITQPKQTIALIPLNEEEKKAGGYVDSPPLDSLTVIFSRLEAQKIGKKKGTEKELAEARDTFQTRLKDTFTPILKRRFAEKVQVQENSDFQTPEFIDGLLKQLEPLRLEKIGYYSIPVKLKFSEKQAEVMDQSSSLMLFIRADAYYEGKGGKFLKGILPLLLTAGSVAVGFNAAAQSGASSYTYTAFGPLPSYEVIHMQMLLVHPKTKELLWYGQVQMFTNFKTPNAVETVASQGANQIPKRFLKTNQIIVK